MWSTHRKKAGNRLFERAQILYSADIKAAIINMFKELKLTMLKELKKDVMTVFHQIVSVEIESTKMNKMEILELKSKLQKWKFTVGLNSRFEQAED